MKTRKIFGVISILAILLALVPVGTVAAGTAKVAVCHLDEMGVYHLITISEMAFPSHVAHGDAAPGDWVPGQEGKKFADDCSLISIEKRTLVDTLLVYGTLNGTQKQVSWSIPLAAGQEYQLEAVGFYKFANWTNAGIADAKYSKRIASVVPGLDGWVDGAALNTDPLKAYGLQVTIYDGNTDKPLTPVGWIEPYNENHLYTAPYTGTGNPLGLFIWDDQYSDNSGYITVKIYQINW